MAAGVALQRIAKLEAELKRRQLLDEDFGREPEDKGASDPRTWSPEKKERVEAARRKLAVASWKVALFFAIPIALVVVAFSLHRR